MTYLNNKNKISIKKMLKSTGKKNIISVILLLCVIAFFIAIFSVSLNISTSLNQTSESVTSDFTTIMDSYEHSFLLYEKLLQQEILHTSNPDEIEAFLKEQDSKLKTIEGNDYDGVYMYYAGHYLYSWDTPHSEYEANGYDATTRPWYIGAVKSNGDLFFSVPYRSYANDYMLATISRLQPDGKTVIAYDIKLGTVSKYVSKLNIYNGSHILICDNSGNIIGSTEPLYNGGNFTLSDEILQENIEIARNNLAKPENEENLTKANEDFKSKRALKELCDKYRSVFLKLKQEKRRFIFSPNTFSFGFSNGNDRYNCYIIIPIITLLPKILIVWFIFSIIFLLFVLLIINIKARYKYAKEIEKKTNELALALNRADEANLSKSRFLAQMSHEIRTPMNAIIGFTTIAKSELSKPNMVEDYLSKIDSSSKLLLGLINNILDMSAIESGKMKIDKSEFDLKNVITNLTNVYYAQAKQKNIDFKVSLNNLTEESVVGDELRLNQVIMNLLSNAIKFTPNGKTITLNITQIGIAQDKVHIRFCVCDTGCGMNEDMKNRLFSPFEQESSKTAKKYGGSGLGLSIVKNLTELMGGSITVESEVDKGSKFTVDLPFGISKTLKQNSFVDFSHIRTLIVDNDIDSCKYIELLLGGLSVPHDFVTSGKEALDKMCKAESEKYPYKLCLIDWKMPQMDGIELTKRIRKLYGKDAAIFIVTAYDLNEAEEFGKEVGADFYISKPLFRSTIFDSLMKISFQDKNNTAKLEKNDNYDFKGKRALVVEDGQLNMIVAVKFLNNVGIETECAVNGKEALETFSKSDVGYYDCIFMDVNMPIMDGYEATKEIRKLNRDDSKTIPIFAMTANAFSEDVTMAINAGMNGHIAKPIEPNALYKTLQKTFNLETKN